MKNWKKGLACLLAGVMVLAMLTACGGAGSQSYMLRQATADSTKALCTSLNVKYSEDLSERAYAIANWIASASVSCRVSEDGRELYRVGSANASVKTFLQQKRYASAFEGMNMGVLGADDFVPGFNIECDLETSGTKIEFEIPLDGLVTTEMKTAAKDKTEMGAAYVVAGDKQYTVTLFR